MHLLGVIAGTMVCGVTDAVVSQVMGSWRIAAEITFQDEELHFDKQLPLRALGAPPMPLMATGIGLFFLAGTALHVMMQ